MKTERVNQYFNKHVAEVYDQWETNTDDVDLIRKLIGDKKTLKILEPFCGTGRMFIPLALDGHTITGLDESEAMLSRARCKVARLDEEVRARIALLHADVTSCDWPEGFDIVILTGNCFYELASADEQENCIASAAASLKPGGYVYVDNNHMEGELDESWRRPGVRKTIFPTGVCSDGTHLEGTTETVWFDAPRRLAQNRRTITMTLPDGSVQSKDYIHQKHPVSAAEVRTWLSRHGFDIHQLYGDRAASPYSDDSPRAIFWAEKR